MQSATYHLTEDLLKLIEQIPDDSIISRVVYKDASLKAVLFGFAQGEALSEHTAAQSTIIHILKGEATVMLNGERHQLRENAWLHMPPHLPHSVIAETPLVMLLLLQGDR
jgi:quercetin dioxygenase-like cupin family protein